MQEKIYDLGIGSGFFKMTPKECATITKIGMVVRHQN